MAAIIPAKVVMLGASGVGKSSLVLRFVLDKFSDSTEATIGAAFLTKSVVCEDHTLKFEIWDTAGQERFKSLAPMYYRNSRVAIVVYDVTSIESFEKAKEWVEEFKSAEQNTERVIALVGNKADLPKKFSSQVAQQYADTHGLLWLETSAKDATNVDKLFDSIAPKLPKPKSGKSSVIYHHDHHLLLFINKRIVFIIVFFLYFFFL
eukprot:TRINITY_DN1529_c0_g1_i3.p1 TRINITY_DN1529_c0_g1~~TRINITY_DN1529_c0_g1_i3.p1  ORF type:complete len:206 (+),score=32.65 TRINITY_DN1529_c0_g1_i3:130-747(+)